MSTNSFSWTELPQEPKRFYIEDDYEFNLRLNNKLLEVIMANEENTTEEVEVVKDATPLGWDDVSTGGEFKLLPEATLLAHIVAVTVERDIVDNFNEGKTFNGVKFIINVNIDENLADGNVEVEDVEAEGLAGEEFTIPLNGNFHQKLSFNDKSKFMDLSKIILQNGKLTEDMIKSQSVAEFFNSFIGKPVYVEVQHKAGKTDSTKKYANIIDISKAVKCPSKEFEAFELAERFTKNQCDVFTA